MENANVFTSQVLDLEKLVEYSNSSVVSKTLIKNDSGNVTLFSFDKGQGLSEHTAPFDAMVNIMDGEASITIQGENYNVKKGETIIMPANIPHALKAEQPFKMMLTMIKGE
jgi:quercetin dioxygenase-like cupin family protein